MIKSMTGFGRYECSNAGRKVTVEMKSVNHRYSEISVRMPKKLGHFEVGIRNILKQYISRGKVDVFLSYEDASEGKTCVKYNEGIAREYLQHMHQMGQTFGLKEDVCVSALASCPEVFSLEEKTEDEQDIWHDVEAAVHNCAERFVETRVAEGESLKADLLLKLNGVLAMVAQVEERSPQIAKEYHSKLKGKVAELLGEAKIDEAVLATELAVFADKICVDEETVRLRAHVQHMQKTLDAGENVGRKLDFIAQEMNREANTILSKANDMDVSGIAINLKTEIEKIREQIQNIE